MAETSKDRKEQRPPQGDLQRQRTAQDQPQKPAPSKQPQPREDLDDDDDRITQRHPAQGRPEEDS